MADANRLVAVVLEVGDLDRAVSLYREGFGLDLHVDDHDGDDRWISGSHAATSWTDGAFIHFALYASKDGTTTAGAQVAFRVDDLESAHDRAVAAGAEIIHLPKSQPWGRSARYRDFDGNVIELTQAQRIETVLWSADGSIAAVEVRPAAPSDAAILAEVHADTWVATYVGHVAADVASERVARARNREWTTHMDLRERLGGGVVALVDRASVVGFCEFGPTEDQDDDPSRVGHIMRIFIRPSHQGRGGGKQLMTAACERLAKRGFASVTLWTPEDGWNHRALEFYRRLGWAREDVRAAGGDIRHRLVLR